MKAFFFPPAAPALTAALLAASGPALAAKSRQAAEPALPRVAGPYSELRKAPFFEAATVPLAKTWGHAIPPGTPFRIEKVYGRWVFGGPLPLPKMRAADHAPPGWLFSRMLVLPGDADTLAPAVAKSSSALLFHAREAWRRLGLAPSGLGFLETLVLSRKTLAAFSLPERADTAASWPRLVPEALAGEEEPPAPLGLTGAELGFLEQEIKVAREKKRKQAQALEASKLKAPPPPPLTDDIRVGLLGRLMLERYLEQPPLSLEEVDGFLYMRATALRALGGCEAGIRRFWEKRRWGFFRVFGLRSRPEQKHPWLEAALPGGYFALSGRAVRLAGDEAELAFLLARQLARELRVKRVLPRFDRKSWPSELPGKAEELWDQALKAQSTRDNEGLDVADEIAIDMQAVECISRAGYRPGAAVAYLRKLAASKEEPWAEWYARNAIGLEYRIGRVQALIAEALAQGKFPEGRESREKRFASAAKQWNILP